MATDGLTGRRTDVKALKANVRREIVSGNESVPPPRRNEIIHDSTNPCLERGQMEGSAAVEIYQPTGGRAYRDWLKSMHQFA